MTTLEKQPCKYGYARVSTSNQTTDTQKEILLRSGIERARIFFESGSSRKRLPEREKLLAELQEGDELHVTKLDRLGSDARELDDIAKALDSKGVVLVIGGTRYDPRDPVSRLLFNVVAMFAEFERDQISSRTKDRIDAIRLSGKRVGRKRSTTPEMDSIIGEMSERGFTTAEIRKVTGVSDRTIYRILQELRAVEEEKNDPTIRRHRRDQEVANDKARSKTLAKFESQVAALRAESVAEYEALRVEMRDKPLPPLLKAIISHEEKGNDQ